MDIINKINAIINNDFINEDGAISANDLINIINKEFGTIKNLSRNKDYLRYEFKIPQYKGIYKYLMNYNASIQHFDFRTNRLMFVFKNKIDMYCHLSVWLENDKICFSDYDDNDIISDKFKNDFISLNANLICHILDNVNYLMTKYNYFINYGKNQFSYNDIFLDNERFFYLIENDNNFYEINIQSQSNEIIDYVNNHFDELLPKIKIRLDTLKPLYKEAVNGYYKENKILIKK